ncbi:tRNA (adenosine(37)-N6)-threonylcarbamoyltransferase complex dimerization subunit type 1 TsaB [Cochlodiniinecator piscidefendens]|uniref:tRNA (adenosine(37)-N6)-threonylcarbamoyltransferase complex dimerization subunit type 1 TsaB n=1 Tax=Cochlodiniinecator piscidefendens TaxID=2715756 RepID=UPI0038B3B53D
MILAFDTSAAHCAAALLSGDEVLAERFEPMTKGQAERLMVLLSEILIEANTGWEELTALAVGVGPGNFTGVRISVSAVRGLSLSLGIPAIGVTGFEALVYGLERPVAATIDARRNQVYWQQFTTAEVLQAEIIDGSEAESRAKGQLLTLVGDQNRPPLFSTANAIARVAATRLGDPVQKPAPLYLRAADAAPPRDPAPKILQ